MVEATTDLKRPPSLRVIGPGLAGLLSLAAVTSLPVLPVLGVLLAVLAPLPLVHLVALGRSSFTGWGWVTVALAGALIVWHTPLLVAFLAGYLLIAVWPAVSVEIWMRRAWSPGRWVSLVTLVALAMAAAVMAAATYPQPVADALTALLQSTAADTSSLLAIFGGPGQGVEELFAQMLHWMAYLAPSLVAGYVMSIALWLRPRLSLLGLERGEEPFARFAADEWLPVGFALGGLGWVFLPEPGKWLALNLLVTVFGLYFIHGLAIIHFYLGPRLSANRWIRLAVALLALQMPMVLLVAVLGLVDNFYRLRRDAVEDKGSDE